MPDTYRVEWESPDHEGNVYRYVSHNMARADAEGMAVTLRTQRTTRVEVLHVEQIHSSLRV